MKVFPAFFQGKGADAVKMFPLGFELGRIHLLVYHWDAWPQSPRELFLLAAIPWPRTIAERTVFEHLTRRSLHFENSDKGKKGV
jgi:hypothetical protein